MSEERKISSKKVLRFSIGVLLVAVFMVALVAASRQQNEKAIKGMEVHLNDENEFSFLQKKDIEGLLLRSHNINLSQMPIEKLDLRMMENVARTNPWVAKADIFVDNRQILQVNIVQREPVARIFDINGGSYYMDSVLNVMPASPGYTYPAPVFTNVPALRNDSLKGILYSKIAYLSEVIGLDSFWNAQITQVEVQPDQSFVLIPLFGNQRILIGDTMNVRSKLSHLFAFYKNVSGKVGWDKYEVLDVRYKDQVIASPSIGWVPPKNTDTATVVYDDPNAKVNTAVVATVAKPVVAKPAVQTVKPAAVVPVKPKPAMKAAIAKKNIAKEKVAAPKEKHVVQASAKVKEKKKEVKTVKDKESVKTQSPKYIYPGKKPGNH
jgi:cell division protein FtsQ